MFDINFYRQSVNWAVEMDQGIEMSPEDVYAKLDSLRSRDPYVYNIETTNACNMRCKMCPRTTRMTRKVSFLNQEVIKRALDQLSGHTKEDWELWKSFCENFYGISEDSDASENHFFLYIIPKVIQLHGYGDPLLDKDLATTIEACNNRGLQTYFSCNPANIDVVATKSMIDNGLDYIKYSFESTDDDKFKDIRGNAANFTEAFRKTETILDYCQSQGAEITVVITMIDVGHDEAQITEFERLKAKFETKNVYIYLKSEDQQWYRKDESLGRYLSKRDRLIPDQTQNFFGTNAIHWSEFCKHPWMSMTLKSDGEVHMCMEDYNNEIFLGDATTHTLREIWNGDLYDKFRRDHVLGAPNIKCFNECDMPKVFGERAAGFKFPQSIAAGSMS